MEARLIFSPPPCKLHPTSPRHKNPRKISALPSPVSPNTNSRGGGSGNNGEAKEGDPPAAPNIRYRVGSRRQQAKRERRKEGEKEKAKGKKKWEEMRASEKAMEIYLGEKGLLFWLNKLAYASIFLVIGGWILFRFVGPSLGFYQLDSPPLSPTSIFKDS